MSEELTTLEPRLKEILYRCLEEIKATKAALYLMDDVEDVFTLVTQYGFRDSTLRPDVKARDEVIDRLIMKRAPFFVNSLTEDPRFSEMLFASDTTRMMVAPIYSRGRLVGFMDVRDKAAKAAFAAADVAAAQKIVDQFIDLFVQKNLYGQKTPTLSNVRVPLVQHESLGPMTPVTLSGTGAPRAVDEARKAIARGVLRGGSPRETLTEQQVQAAAAVLPAALALPGLVVAGIGSFGKLGGAQVVAARAEVTEPALQQFQAKLRAWLQKRDSADGVSKTSVVYPLGKAGAPIEPNRLVSMLSAPVLAGGVQGVVFTAAFEMPPSPQSRTMLTDILRQAQQLIDHAVAHEQLHARNQRIAEKLLEPDFETYPALAAHSRRVSDLAERLAAFVGLPPSDVESVRLAALLHDVGMRMLDYANLYRKAVPTAEELKIMREHPLVGAALVAESALGPEIAGMVLAHHERPDGAGYPNGASGDAIPLGARIIHICEAFDAMTAADSYQTAVPVASALQKIRRAGGAQFDETLATRFVEMLS